MSWRRRTNPRSPVVAVLLGAFFLFDLSYVIFKKTQTWKTWKLSFQVLGNLVSKFAFVSVIPRSVCAWPAILFLEIRLQTSREV
jgi:hypothetical protein